MHLARADATFSSSAAARHAILFAAADGRLFLRPLSGGLNCDRQAVDSIRGGVPAVYLNHES